MFSKKGVSFSSVVAIMGSILIAVGIAWLLADNWHIIPKFLKIIILLLLTAGAYFGGTFATEKEYQKIGQAFFVLGALLYTLSIFLIAQLFFTQGSWQGQAWLWLLAWVGVMAASYIFSSAASLIVGLTELVVWVSIQFMAFQENTNLSVGILLFYFLSLGVLLYGLGLYHKLQEHDFTRVYRWWTAFYVLAFVYALSFQLLLPNIWPGEAVSSTGALVFLFVLVGAALVALLVGVIPLLRDRDSDVKETLWFIGIVIALIALIGSTGFVGDVLGQCQEKSCYNSNQENCKAMEGICYWDDTISSCGSNKEYCSTSTMDVGSLGCEDKFCKSLSAEYKIKCEQNPSCIWGEHETGRYSCVQNKGCDQFANPTACENSLGVPSCKWIASGFNRCTEKDLCEDYSSKDSCSEKTICQWHPTNNPLRDQQYPPSLWLLWIIINIFFLALIIGIIFYGTWQKQTSLINLGIVFFALDIITRYIGFIIDLHGYLGLSFIFITGGLLLLGGGWGIEHWRKKLIAEVK
ncbi:DUF2157 domain-containing protein [Candidatus Woesearchaeota archaeon]|nr:DUF2157 domain-containing protein [Candidatus Woesearchaeota archaeon]